MNIKNEEISFLKDANSVSKAGKTAPGTHPSVPNTLFPIFPLKPTYPGLSCFALNKILEVQR